MKASKRIVPIAIVIALLAVAFPMPMTVLASDLYEYYNTGDDNYGNPRGVCWYAQTFSPSEAHKITSVELKLFRIGSPGTLTVGIRATDGSGHPTGEDLCSGTINGNTLTTDDAGVWYKITLGDGCNLLADTKYAIVVRVLDGDSDNCVYWRVDYTSATYAGGNCEYSENSGSVWVSYTNWDFMFEERGEPTYEYYITGDDIESPVKGDKWDAQTFTPSIAHKITNVKLLLYRLGSPGTLTIGIRAVDGNGKPTGGDLCIGTTDGDTLPTGSPYEWREITLGAGYNLDADTKYAIVVRAPNGDDDNCVYWRVDYTSATYAGGNYCSSEYAGNGWTSYVNWDFMFEEWGEPVEVPTVTTQAVSDIEPTTATGNGNITDTGGENCSKRGVCWNTTGNPTVADSKSEETDSFGTGAFTRPMTGLTPCEHYYVKAYAYNSAGYGYGSQVEFDTLEATLYEYYITGDSSANATYNALIGQTFTPSIAHKITSVKLLLYRLGSLGTFTVQIRTTDGEGKPTAEVLCSGTSNGNTLPTESPYEWREIMLGGGYDLSADVKYAIVVLKAGDVNNKLRWRYDNSAPTYEGGNEVYSYDDITWGHGAGDCMFEEWGEPFPYPAYQNMTEIGVASASEITIPAPAGFSPDDLFLVFITKDDDVLINEHGDWTTLHNVTCGTGNAIYCAWRTAVEGDTGWTWTGDSEAYYGAIICYSGQDAATPINISDVTTGDDSTPIAPDVETTRDDCTIFQAFGVDDDDAPYTVPGSPFVERFHDSYTTTGGAGGDWVLASQGQTGTGVFGVQDDQWGAVTVAIQPPLGVTPDITNAPTSYGFGTVDESSTPATGLTYFTVTNNSGAAVSITIRAIDFIGGNGWTLSDTATPSPDTAGLKAGLEFGDYTIVVKKSESFNILVSGLADEATQRWGLKLYAPTSHSDGAQKSTTVTLTAILD